MNVEAKICKNISTKSERPKFCILYRKATIYFVLENNLDITKIKNTSLME